MAVSNSTNTIMAVVVERIAEAMNLRAPATRLARIIRLADGQRWRSPIPPRRATQNQAAGGALRPASNVDVRAVTLDPDENNAGDWVSTDPLNISHAELVRIAETGVSTVLEEFADSTVQAVDRRLMGLGSQAGTYISGAGQTSVLNPANLTTVAGLLALRQAFRRAGVNVMGDGRPTAVINDASYVALASQDEVLRADARGNTTTVATGGIEGIAGFREVMDTDLADTPVVNPPGGGARTVNRAGGYTPGYQGSFTIDGAGAGTVMAAGTPVRFGSQDVVYQVQTSAAGTFTLSMPLVEAVADNATVTHPAAFRAGLAARPGAIALAYRQLPTGQLDNGFGVMSTHPTGINVRLTRIGSGLASSYQVDLLYDVQVVQPRGVVRIGLAN